MRTTIVLLLTCFLSGLHGQVSISGGWSQDSVVIGDEASLTISIEVNEGIEILAVSSMFVDSIYSSLATTKAHIDTTQPVIPQIADFELLSLGNWKDPGEDQIFSGEELSWNISQAGGKTLYENTIKYRLWDPADIIALYPTILYTDATGQQEQYHEEGQMKTFVIPPGGLVSQDSLTIEDIKPILQEPVKLSDYLIYFIIIGAAIILGLIYWLFTKFYKSKEKSVVKVIEPKIVLPAHEIALDKLAKLQSQQLWQKGEVKTYQSHLTYIIREYLENRYDVQALESTTDEIVELIKNQLMTDDVSSLKRILQVADLVKFAKATPEENIHDRFMNEAMNFVQKTKIEATSEDQL